MPFEQPESLQKASPQPERAAPGAPVMPTRDPSARTLGRRPPLHAVPRVRLPAVPFGHVGHAADRQQGLDDLVPGEWIIFRNCLRF